MELGRSFRLFFTHPIAWGVYVFVWFVVLFQVLYDPRALNPHVLAIGPRVTLSASDLATLLTGAVTAASLAAVYSQMGRSQQEERLAMAMRAADLQAVYYSQEMIQARVRADLCLLDLSRDSAALEEMVRYWVDQDFAKLPSILGRACHAHGVTVQQAAEALTMMVGFYVRVAYHLESHKSLSGEQKVSIMDLLGWRSWRRHGLLAFAESCQRHQLNTAEKVGTYFVGRLRQLEAAYVTLKPIPPEHRTVGVRRFILPSDLVGRHHCAVAVSLPSCVGMPTHLQQCPPGLQSREPAWPRRPVPNLRLPSIP